MLIDNNRKALQIVFSLKQKEYEKYDVYKIWQQQFSFNDNNKPKKLRCKQLLPYQTTVTAHLI